jgi:hypothetical protein
MVTLLLSTAALVLLTALGAGALLYVAASSKEVDESEDAERAQREEAGRDDGGRRG